MQQICTNKAGKHTIYRRWRLWWGVRRGCPVQSRCTLVSCPLEMDYFILFYFKLIVWCMNNCYFKISKAGSMCIAWWKKKLTLSCSGSMIGPRVKLVWLLSTHGFYIPTKVQGKHTLSLKSATFFHDAGDLNNLCSYRLIHGMNNISQ